MTGILRCVLALPSLCFLDMSQTEARGASRFLHTEENELRGFSTFLKSSENEARKHPRLKKLPLSYIQVRAILLFSQH